MYVASDYYVQHLPGQPADSQVRMHAGYSQQFTWAKLTIRHITVDEEHDGALFFWHFANKHIADRPRTVRPNDLQKTGC
jgi:carboxypeptidase D